MVMCGPTIGNPAVTYEWGDKLTKVIFLIFQDATFLLCQGYRIHTDVHKSEYDVNQNSGDVIYG